MLLKIISKKRSTFTGDDGSEVVSFWYEAERLSDNLRLRFVTLNDGYEEGTTEDLNVVKREGKKGFYYKEEM